MSGRHADRERPIKCVLESVERRPTYGGAPRRQGSNEIHGDAAKALLPIALLATSGWSAVAQYGHPRSLWSQHRTGQLIPPWCRSGTHRRMQNQSNRTLGPSTRRKPLWVVGDDSIDQISGQLSGQRTPKVRIGLAERRRRQSDVERGGDLVDRLGRWTTKETEQAIDTGKGRFGRREEHRRRRSRPTWAQEESCNTDNRRFVGAIDRLRQRRPNLMTRSHGLPEGDSPNLLDNPRPQRPTRTLCLLEHLLPRVTNVFPVVAIVANQGDTRLHQAVECQIGNRVDGRGRQGERR
mmetsp:Transcript_8199/g.26191  ORF Transcript_8199/g.26191 Transcript_8199/m.26191 type:complete len:294 (+) Transcript_8199:603-1484(+)